MSRERDQRQQQIEWRRSRVLELSSQGRTEREIATMLQVGKTTVDRDLVYLRKQSQENLRSHIQERLPEQYQKCMNGLNQVLTMTWNIVVLDSVNHASRLQALSLINDCYKYIMDLTTNGVVITDAIKFVQTNKEKLMSTNEDKNGDKESEESESDEYQLEKMQEEEIGEQETTNNTF